MYSDEILEQIVEKVLQKLEQRMKTALVVFTGASIGFKEAVQQLRILLDEGWRFKVVLTKSAEYVLTPQLVKKQLGIGTVYLEREIEGLAALYKNVGLIIIPTLTLNTAVKIAMGIADGLAANLVAHGLMEGIPVIAARNACDLKNAARLQLGMNKTPEAYLSRMNQYLDILESYGIELADAGELHERALGRSIRSSAGVRRFDGKVLSRMDIIDAKNAGVVLSVSRSTIVTDLAYDTAREFGVRILRE